MRRTLIALTLITLGLLTYSSIANACGDKFLVLGKGLRYERAHAAVHPGSILIYENKNLEDPKAGNDLEKALKKAGHTIQTVNDVSKLDATLRSGKFDLVLLNLSDATLLEEQIIKSPSRPAVIPIIYNRTGDEVAAAGKQYDCVLKAASKNTNVLQIVDDAVGDRKKGAPVKCKWSK
jgi:DNA-binding NtrC family response regulator